MKILVERNYFANFLVSKQYVLNGKSAGTRMYQSSMFTDDCA